MTREQLNGLFNSKRVKGEIGYYGLEDWWLDQFTEEERNIIMNTYQPMGLGSDSLVKKEIQSSFQSKLVFLSGLSSWFKKPEYYPIVKKKYLKKQKHLSTKLTISSMYISFIKIRYRYIIETEILIPMRLI